LKLRYKLLLQFYIVIMTVTSYRCCCCRKCTASKLEEKKSSRSSHDTGAQVGRYFTASIRQTFICQHTQKYAYICFEAEIGYDI